MRARLTRIKALVPDRLKDAHAALDRLNDGLNQATRNAPDMLVRFFDDLWQKLKAVLTGPRLDNAMSGPTNSTLIRKQARADAPRLDMTGGQDIRLASTIDGEPMDSDRFARMKKAFEQNEGKVLQGDDVDEYLKYRKAEGITDNSKQILLKSKPSTSSIYEEFIHATQHRTGRYDNWVKKHGNQGAEILAEIEVAEKLMFP